MLGHQSFGYYTPFVKLCLISISDDSASPSDWTDHGSTSSPFDKLRISDQRPSDTPCLTLEGLHRPIELAGQERHQDGAAVQEEGSDG